MNTNKYLKADRNIRPLQLLFLIFFVIFLMIAIVELVTFDSFNKALVDSIARRSLDQAGIVAETFKISSKALEEIKSLPIKDTLINPDTLRFKEQVRDITKLKDIKYVYIISRLPDSEVRYSFDDPELASQAGYPLGTPMNFLYVLTSEDESGYSEIDRYEGDFFEGKYDTKQPFYILGDDLRWDTALTGLYPFNTTDGVFAGYVGVDIGMESYYSILYGMEVTFWILLTVIVFMLISLFILLVVRISHSLYRDSLTGLLNRNIYHKILERRLEKKSDGISAFFFLDLDGFKSVNDSMGHLAGDHLLIMIAKRLQAITGRRAVLIRIAGDEFGVFKQGFKDENDICEYGNKIVQDLSQQLWYIDGIPIRIGVSAGGSIWQKPARTTIELIEYADFAMYMAKSEGKNRLMMFDYNNYNVVEHEQRLYREIAAIIMEKRYTHVFQPIVDMKTGKVAGYEGLTRFKDDDEKRGIVSSYLNVIGKGKALERMLSENIALTFKNLKGDRNVFLSINESIEDLYDGLSYEEYKSYQQIYTGLNAVVEINDPCFSEVDSVMNKAVGVRSMGQRIALDNFVTGTRSAAMLVGMNPEIIKLSPNLIRDVEHSPQIRRFVSLAVRFAHKINSQVVAVGVETKKTIKILKQLGVDYVQGFLIGKPEEVLNDISEDIKRLILEEE